MKTKMSIVKVLEMGLLSLKRPETVAKTRWIVFWTSNIRQRDSLGSVFPQ